MFLVIDLTSATTVIKKSFNRVAQESELIFEGRAISKETRPSPTSGMPFTYFVFEIIEVIKGNYPDQTIELGFMGGPQGDRILRVSDMRMPEVGERGIYFVKTLKEQHIHPLSGWHQGHYLVIASEQTSMDVVVPVIRNKNRKNLSKAVRSIPLEDFKQRIRNVMEEGQ